MALNLSVAAPHKRTHRLQEEGIGVALAIIAFGIALLAPIVAYLVALLAIYLCVRNGSRLTTIAIVAFACAGSIIFASRNFVDGPVDFINYYSVFSTVCSHGPAEDGILAFGPEVGLPALYQLLSVVGTCDLSISGLAFVQCLLVSALLLGVAARVVKKRVAPQFRAEVVVGLAVLFSFFFITQLSRQALSCVFLLYALMLAPTRRRVMLALAGATICHLTAPIVYLAAILLRRRSRVVIPIVLVVALVVRVTFNQIVTLALGDEWGGALDKLNFYTQLQASSGGAPSDILTVVYLLVAASAYLLAKRRSPADTADMRMLFGLGLLSAVLLPLPLAATRFALLFGSLIVGYFVFAALTAWWPTVARMLLVVLVCARVLSLSTVNEGADNALWTNHSSWSLVPGYFLPTYVRPL